MTEKKGFFIVCATAQYESWAIEEKPTEEAVIEFLNFFASNPHFEFRVFPLESEMKYEPAEIVKTYRRVR